MRVLVIGASGRTGKLVLDELHNRGMLLYTSCKIELKTADELQDIRLQCWLAIQQLWKDIKWISSKV